MRQNASPGRLLHQWAKRKEAGRGRIGKAGQKSRKTDAGNIANGMEMTVMKTLFQQIPEDTGGLHRANVVRSLKDIRSDDILLNLWRYRSVY